MGAPTLLDGLHRALAASLRVHPLDFIQFDADVHTSRATQSHAAMQRPTETYWNSLDLWVAAREQLPPAASDRL
ncbi:MAG: hypothetical protein NDI84_09585 [Steroidobacteraceae bacterium]|nr:hypothetical protein [Steroidobacteraceae bacterium]